VRVLPETAGIFTVDPTSDSQGRGALAGGTSGPLGLMNGAPGEIGNPGVWGAWMNTPEVPEKCIPDDHALRDSGRATRGLQGEVSHWLRGRRSIRYLARDTAVRNAAIRSSPGADHPRSAADFPGVLKDAIVAPIASTASTLVKPTDVLSTGRLISGPKHPQLIFNPRASADD
jgi:hypothetical protein